ncbi:Uncharacterised protein [Arthrobacter agilis]|nr:Uncharacterised protein [Arthrobacter agilis]
MSDADRTAEAAPTPGGKSLTREMSPLPPAMKMPTTTITRTSPETSMTVMTTLLRTDSLMPRMFSSASRTRNTRAAGTAGTSMNVVR